MMSRKEKQEQINKAINYFIQNDISITKCASIFGIHRTTLGIHLKRNNVSEDRRRKYFFNEDYFKNIDSEEKAYWLGFIAADGCILENGTLKISLAEKDSSHLEKFNKSIESNRPILFKKETYIYKDGKTRKNPLVLYHGKTLAKDLEKYNIVPRKSFSFEPTLELINPNLHKHYIRGYFDGDGWISIGKNTKEVGFAGTESTCNVFSTHLIENCTIRNYSITQLKNIYRFRVNNLDSITSILKYLYGDATVYLDRKYNLFKKICRCEK